MIYLGKNLVCLRKRDRLTAAELCDRLGFKRNTYSNWENDLATPDLPTIIRLADFFKIDISELISSDLSNTHLIPESQTAKKQVNTQVNAHLNALPKGKKQHSSTIVEEPGIPYNSPDTTIHYQQQLLTEKERLITSQQVTISALQTALNQALQENERLKKEV